MCTTPARPTTRVSAIPARHYGRGATVDLLLLGSRLYESCAIASWLPRTAVHVLSNGRRFSDASFAQRYSAVLHSDFVRGIPLYSDLSTIHDYVVQADGAFDETIRGILNLKRLGEKVEIRVVLHRQTYERLPYLAEVLVAI